MRPTRLTIGFAGATLAFARALPAATPIYSFETLYNNAGLPDPTGTRPDGFFAVGGGTSVARDTVGTTDGSSSLKFSMVAPATFSGARTAQLRPELDDPAVYALVCDVTIPATGNFAGGFARLGITAFGNNQSQGIIGGQAQTTSTAEANIELAPGTYHVTVPLIARGNPITFDANVPFHTIFGDDPDTQMVAGEFQYYINKSGDSPILVYIDNVLVAKAGDINGDGRLDPDDYALIDRGLLRTFPVDAPPGWVNGDLNTDGSVNANDYLLLDTAYVQQQGGTLSPALLADRQAKFGGDYVSALTAAVPEPSAAALVAVAAVATRTRRRHARR
jgi:hypothetical protein